MCCESNSHGFVFGTGSSGALGVAQAIGIGGAFARQVVGRALGADLVAACLARRVDGAQVPADRQGGEHTGDRQPHGGRYEAEQELHGITLHASVDSRLSDDAPSTSPTAVTAKHHVPDARSLNE